METEYVAYATSFVSSFWELFTGRFGSQFVATGTRSALPLTPQRFQARRRQQYCWTVSVLERDTGGLSAFAGSQVYDKTLVGISPAEIRACKIQNSEIFILYCPVVFFLMLKTERPS
jgi:hypothetical protein